MTANAMAGDRERVLAVGMNDHISKPIDVEEMFATMARWIRPDGRRPPVVAAGTATGTIAPPAASRAGLGSLPGIDVPGGLRRTLNNATLYRNMLQQFASSNARFSHSFTSALDAGDLGLAARLAHTLRGTAGTIGANGVWQAATELELACNQGRARAQQLAALVRVGQELSPVLAGLSALSLASAPPPAPAWAGSADEAHEQLRKLTRELRALLADSDPGALNLRDALHAAARGSAAQPIIVEVLEAVDKYRFDDALEALDRWSARG